jgi:GT2 family glycosyltransferase
MKNKIGVAVPTYNRNEMLTRLLNTIPKDVVVAVSDNGNYVSEALKNQFSNVHFEPTVDILPIFQNWNAPLKHLISEWVCIPSDDDLFYEHSFDIFYDAIEKNTDVDMIIGGHNIIDENDVKVSSWVPTSMVLGPLEAFDYFKYGVEARMPSILFKREAFDKAGGFDEYFTLTAGDSDLIQRIMLNGNVAFIDKVVSAYRSWPGALTSSKNASKLWIEEIYYWQQKICDILISKGVNKRKARAVQRQVVMNNIISGLINIKRDDRGVNDGIRFLNEIDYPYRAKLKSHLMVVRELVKLF